MAIRVQRFAVGMLVVIVGIQVLSLFGDRPSLIDAPGWLILLTGALIVAAGAAHAWRGIADED